MGSIYSTYLEVVTQAFEIKGCNGWVCFNFVNS